MAKAATPAPWEQDTAPEPNVPAIPPAPTTPVVQEPTKDPEPTPSQGDGASGQKSPDDTVATVVDAVIPDESKQAPLALISLLGRGMSMADAKAKLGIE